jgi:hypothetical protein
MNKEARQIINYIKNLSSDKRDELTAGMVGMTIEQQKESSRIYEESKKYCNIPIEQWPDFEIKWDLSHENRRFAFDGYDEATYKKYYPNGLIAGIVNFKEFNLKLAKHSQRTKDEIWDTSSPTKLARTILYYIEGNAMTPPFICIDKDITSVMIGGGYHRVAVCLAKDAETIPILVSLSEKSKIERILTSVKWDDK